MEQWQDAASQQAKLLTKRLNELLSQGQELLRSELGVDLGLKPELIPPWVILLAACCGLVLMVALWASTCRALFSKRPALSPVDEDTEVNRDVIKPVKSEEPKKKKKKAEKKAQANGRAVAEPQEEEEEAPVTEESQQPAAQGKAQADKAAEAKKSKKKAKQQTKETKTVTAAGKEPEEGTWETKVSNKEKREQRKKDKGSSDGSASPGGGSTPPEQPKASAAPPPPAAHKKKKGETTKVKAEKVEAVVPPVVLSEVAAVVPDVAVNVAPPKSVPWTAGKETATQWGAELDESWTVIDRGVHSAEPSVVSLSGLAAAAPAEPQPVSDLSWISQPKVDDEWSGFNGGVADPGSDWSAPAEVWGNYEEPPPPAQEQPLPEPTKVVNVPVGAADNDEEENDKGEGGADGAKTKKKKKKKKKASEEGGAAGQGDEPEKEPAPVAPVKKQPPVQEKAAAVQPARAAAVETKVEQPMKESASQKAPVTQVPPTPTDGEATAKQSTTSAPTQQKKPEESQAAPKPAKKKKARRET